MYEELQNGMFGWQVGYLEERVAEGNVDAMYLLGKLYWDNDCDTEEVFKWFSKAAEKGQADAIYYLGNFYRHPDGWGLVEPNNEKASQCYAKAAELGSALAICELGQQCLHSGKDAAKAVELFKKAAELGESEAYYWLARCYQFGDGVEKDLEKALKMAFNAYETK